MQLISKYFLTHKVLASVSSTDQKKNKKTDRKHSNRSDSLLFQSEAGT